MSKILTVTKLAGGNIVITTSTPSSGGGDEGGSSSGSSEYDPTKTRFTLENGTVEDYEITGTLTLQWFIDHGFAMEVSDE